MEYRTLGKTGLNLSTLGFGASPFGGAFGSVSEREATRAVKAAIELGVNYFDVAPYYGLTRAEYVLGQALRTVPRDAYYLSTKVGRYDKDVFDFSPSRVTKSVDESLKRLGVDHIDLIICHDVEFGSLKQIVHETIPALRRVQKSGKVGFVGISALPLKMFKEVSTQVEIDFILSYCHYCLNDTSLADLAPLLTGKGIGVINASPLSMGLLTEGGPPEWHPASIQLRNACAEAARHCLSKSVDISWLALQFSLAQTIFTSTLIGILNAEQIIANVQLMALPLDPVLLRDVMAILRPVHNQTWLSGRSENNDITAIKD
jgi:L-galactose dehydrogenase